VEDIPAVREGLQRWQKRCLLKSRSPCIVAISLSQTLQEYPWKNLCKRNYALSLMFILMTLTHAPMTERQVRPVAAEPNWDKQRRRFKKLMDSVGRNDHV
jgi:hypothetical protein